MQPGKHDRRLAITAVVGCKNKCSYCPQDPFVRAYLKRSRETSMSFETFRTCVDKVPTDVCINFAGFAEPWFNPACTDMLLYAFDKGHRIRVFTTMTGMTEQDVERIRRVPFETFTVHLADGQNKTRIRVDDQYLSVLDRLLTYGLSNAEYIFHFTQGGNEDVHEEAKRVFARHGIEPKRRGLVTRAGNVTIDGQNCPVRLEGTLQHCRRFYVNSLLPNGDVVLCCMDWGLKHILGNLVECRYEDLHQGETFQLILRGQKDAKLDILCRTCEEARLQPSQWTRLRRAAGRLVRRPAQVVSEPDVLE